MSELERADSRPASERYKEAIGWAQQAIREIEERDAKRATQLAAEARAAHERLTRAVDDEILTWAAVRLGWEAAVDALWDERWLTITPLPRPASDAPRRPPSHFDQEMSRAVNALEDALRKRSIIPRRRRD